MEEENSGQSAAEKKLKDLNRQLEFQVDELMEQLETADQARNSLKTELREANEKTINLEEELYGTKQEKNEILE